MKLAEAENHIRLNNIKLEALRSELINELKLNQNCSGENIETILSSIEDLFLDKIKLETRLTLTRALGIVNKKPITYFYKEAQTLQDKVTFYNEVIEDVIEFYTTQGIGLDINLRGTLNTITNSVNRVMEDCVRLKDDIFSIEMGMDLIDKGVVDGSDTAE